MVGRVERSCRKNGARRSAWSLALVVLFGCGASATPVQLRRVVLYQNGVGYFEREGRVENGRVALRLAPHEVDDVLTTLTVVDRGGDTSTSPSAAIPSGEDDAPRTLTLDLGDRPRDVRIAYSAPTPVWRATYRVVLDESGEQALLQAWAVVHNASPEDWTDVDLALATSAPFAYRVDLRDRRFFERPDATGRGAGAPNRGSVGSIATRGGYEHANDACPGAEEDRDGFEDDDGCPDPDNDQDRILDVDDQCPNDPETYNGLEDEDGCPDRGQVTIEHSQIQILEKIYFARGAAETQTRQEPILDALAATLVHNPQITRVRIDGHASADEANGWALSAERAGAVRVALIARGVAEARLVAQAFGSTQPLDPRTTEEAYERNRRVEFQIEARDEGDTGVRAGAVAQQTVAEVATDAAGATRYGLARRVSVPAGASAMVTVMSERVPGRAVLVFDPQADVEGAGRFPLRAAHLRNTVGGDAGVDLVAGPVTLFGGGELLGEGLLDALPAGRSVMLPYGLDRSTTVEVTGENEETPSRVVGIARGVVQLERIQSRRTRYVVTAGARVPGTMFLRYQTAGGFELVEAPPGYERVGETYWVPLPLTASRTSTLELIARRPTQVSVDLMRDFTTDLAPYVQGSALPEAVARGLAAILEARVIVVEREVRERALRVELGDLGQRNAEVRATLGALDGRRDAEGRRLRAELSQRVEEGIRRMEALAQELSTVRAEREAALERLREAVREPRWSME
ncbi:MAG: OmpA family protein [Sandaracinus sp.]|nr:OmpA family protein [Sandaracinus sp.]MCB9616510.1 OmpA family protein [Sandaracinus sp.]MCB9635845.1 OmpA family protein [Sandaracinus sp.]